MVCRITQGDHKNVQFLTHQVYMYMYVCMYILLLLHPFSGLFFQHNLGKPGAEK